MPVLADFALETFFSRWEFTARFHLTASDAESIRLRELLAMAGPEDAEAFNSLWLGYTETFGSPLLRAAIASTYNNQTADDILCFAGAEEGIYVAMNALLDRGDHAIVVTPNYQAAETVPLSLCEVTGVPLDPDHAWSLDIDRVAQAIRPNTRLVSINFPHNPTGKILEYDRLMALVTLCRKRGLWLFSDEVYRLLGLHPERNIPQVADIYEKGLSLNVMSKAYGLAGLRIGWIATADRKLRVKMERFKHYLSICNSAPGELLARIALKHRERILARNNQLLSDNFVLLEEFFADFQHLFQWYRPDGGCVAYPRYLGPGPVEAFTQDLVERAGVLLLPATVYRSQLGPTPTDRFRIGYGRAAFGQGLQAFRHHLRGDTAGGALAQP
jgi:aspartate/methionine/tyrosine aminotransferase